MELNALFEKEIERWFADKGDANHRLNYDLGENSVVFDVGGYEGKWSELIRKKSKCNIHIFEPIHSFSAKISEKFKNDSKVKVYNFGLGGSDKVVNISLEGDASSVYRGGDNTEAIDVKRASDFLNNFEFVDLMKINIEGEEYDLLDDLIKTGCVGKIKNIQVQFHTFIEGCQQRRDAIRKELSKTHVLTYNYDFVWENWKLK